MWKSMTGENMSNIVNSFKQNDANIRRRIGPKYGRRRTNIGRDVMGGLLNPTRSQSDSRSQSHSWRISGGHFHGFEEVRGKESAMLIHESCEVRIQYVGRCVVCLAPHAPSVGL